MSDPRDVDVTILSWERSDETIAAIRSALGQKGVTVKVWVVDQGSSAACVERLRKLADTEAAVDVQFLSENIGAAAGRNLASSRGHAPYIVSLDNDAVFADDLCLRRLVDRCELETDLGAVAFRILDARTLDDDLSCWGYPRQPSLAGATEFPAARFCDAGRCIRRAAFAASGGYDESLFFMGEEPDLAYRILARGWSIRYFPDVVVLHAPAQEKRTDWGNGRYYRCVRNSLYTDFKFGRSPTFLCVSTLAWLAKGLYNGLIRDTLRAIGHAIVLSYAFRRDGDRQAYVLPLDIRHYIDMHDVRRPEPILRKIRKQFTPLANST